MIVFIFFFVFFLTPTTVCGFTISDNAKAEIYGINITQKNLQTNLQTKYLPKFLKYKGICMERQLVLQPLEQAMAQLPSNVPAADRPMVAIMSDRLSKAQFPCHSAIYNLMMAYDAEEAVQKLGEWKKELEAYNISKMAAHVEWILAVEFEERARHFSPLLNKQKQLCGEKTSSWWKTVMNQTIVNVLKQEEGHGHGGHVDHPMSASYTIPSLILAKAQYDEIQTEMEEICDLGVYYIYTTTQDESNLGHAVKEWWAEHKKVVENVDLSGMQQKYYMELEKLGFGPNKREP